MAIVQNTLIGKASGSVGGTTFTSWKGKNVLKAKPTQVANPRTQAQTDQRSVFVSAINLYRMASLALSLGFNALAVGKSAYNAFVSENLKNGSLSKNVESNIYDLDTFKTAKGSLTPTASFTVEEGTTPNTVKVSWPSGATGGQSSADSLLLFITDGMGNNVLSKVVENARNLNSHTTEVLPAALAADTVHVFAAFYNPATRVAEDSRKYSLTLI